MQYMRTNFAYDIQTHTYTQEYIHTYIATPCYACNDQFNLLYNFVFSFYYFSPFPKCYPYTTTITLTHHMITVG